MSRSDIIIKFEDKLKQLEKFLPTLKQSDINCAELTFTNILQILGIDNHLFHNAIIPLASGFGGYKSKKGWMGACGAVTGGCASIGIIQGGLKSRMNNLTMFASYLKARKFCSDFETNFGSIVCSEICGFDFSTSDGIKKYIENDVWRNKCYKYILWAINKVQKLTRKELKEKWI